MARLTGFRSRRVILLTAQTLFARLAKLEVKITMGFPVIGLALFVVRVVFGEPMTCN